MSDDRLTLRGVDGCPAGWLCVSLDQNDGRLSAMIFPDASTLLRDGAGAVTAIDIPIGLPQRGARRCDLEARAILGPRKASVFPAPLRCTLSSRSYEDACAASAAVCGKRLSKQAYAILPKIREVDTLLRETPTLARTVYEVHPEVCFYYWNSRQAMKHPKQAGFGFLERFRLVDNAFPGAAERIRYEMSPGQASDDDVLDALAALWTATRIYAGTAARLGNPPELDEHDLPMQMLA